MGEKYITGFQPAVHLDLINGLALIVSIGLCIMLTVAILASPFKYRAELRFN
jgi:hypothetical protein